MLKNDRSRRTLLAVPIALLLASAAPAHAGGIPSGPWSHLWAWLSAWTGLSLDVGPGIDPNGGHGDGAESDADEGSRVDPNGHHWSSAFGKSDSGPGIDPLGGDGASTPPSSTDSGPTIDPDGRNL